MKNKMVRDIGRGLVIASISYLFVEFVLKPQVKKHLEKGV